MATTKKNEEQAQEAATEAAAAERVREKESKEEKVVQKSASDITPPLEGGAPVPRNGDPFAAQRAAGAGNFKPINEEAK